MASSKRLVTAGICWKKGRVSMRLTVRGIKPPRYKSMTAEKPVGVIDAPGRVGVRLLNCSFADTVECITRGDAVQRGGWYRIKGVQGAFMATVSGVYEGAAMLETPDNDGIPCAVITAKGAQDKQVVVCSPRKDTPSLEELIAIAERAAIIDEFDGLPLCEKLQAWRDIAPDCVAVDASDPQPYGTAGEAVLLQAAAQVYEGARLCASAVGARRTVVAVPVLALIPKISKIIGRRAVVRRDSYYPHESVYGGAHPRAAVGPQACLALQNAVRNGFGQTDMIVTVSGDGVEQPQNLYAPVGCMAQVLFDSCKERDTASLFVLGDALSGIEIEDLLTPVWQDTMCVLAMTQAVGPRSESHCTRCGLCAGVCHKGLNPCEIMFLYREGRFEELAAYRAELCDGCGCCSFVCPSGCEVTAQVTLAASLGDAFEIEIGGADDATV